MNRVVVDIETVGLSLESLEEPDRQEVDRWAEQSKDGERVYAELGLNALTGRVVAIAMLNPDTGKGRVHVQPAEAAVEVSRDGAAQFVPGGERDLLERFWRDVQRYEQVITFNGRGFDVPFLVYRSAAHGIAPTLPLLGRRYSEVPHCDLMDQLSFYGAVWPRRSLHFYCRLFGIESPKVDGMAGGDVGDLWAEGRHEDIAEYCWRDVIATARLFEVWRDLVSPASGGAA
jgi:DNA polymerase elongation subunit (family B)